MQHAFSSEAVPVCDKAERGFLNTLKGQQRENSCSAFPQFIVVQHLKVLFWRDAQTRNISLRVRFDLVIEFYDHFTYSAVHLYHLQHFTVRRARMSKCISIPRSFHL